MLAAGLGPAAASSGNDLRMEPAPINRLDVASLQRGARTFVNYCLNCHSAKYMRYNRLTDLGIDLAMIEDNLMFATNKVGETMTVAMTRSRRQGVVRHAAAGPDGRVARVRGADWLYNYFLGFYKDDATATGWNNLVFPNVAMPHVLWQLFGDQPARHHRVREPRRGAGRRDRRQGARAARAGARTASTSSRRWRSETPGTLSPTEYKAMVADLVNYLDYMGEPTKNQRISLGLIALLYLVVLFVFAYWLKREYWKDVH